MTEPGAKSADVLLNDIQEAADGLESVTRVMEHLARGTSGCDVEDETYHDLGLLAGQLAHNIAVAIEQVRSTRPSA